MNSDSTKDTGRAKVKYRIHWHVLLIHFPISAFLGSFVFISLHLFTRTYCFALAAYVSLIAGAIVMLPTAATGWFTWKGRYKRFKGKMFLYKIRISLAMIVVSIALVIFQTVFPFSSLDIRHNIWHAIYFTGVTLLMLGAMAEGYYGGRLHHR